MAEIVDYRGQLARLKKGIAWAWVLNVGWLTITTMAALALLFIYQGFRGTKLLHQLAITSPFAVGASLLTVWLVSVFSWRAIQAGASKDMVKVEQGAALYYAVEEAVVASGTPLTEMPDIYIAADKMEPNAFALSHPKGSMIVFTRGLLEILDPYEIRAVAAHEWGHITSGDSRAMTKLIALANVIGIIQSLVINFFINTLGFIRPNNDSEESSPLDTIITIAVGIISLLTLLLAPLISSVLQAFMSRKRESNADARAVEYTRNPAALASALQKISGQNVHDKELHKNVKQLAFFSQNPLATHPPVEQRIKDLEAMSGMTLQ